MSKCTHSVEEQDAARIEGNCPLCLKVEVERLREKVKCLQDIKLKEFGETQAAKYQEELKELSRWSIRWVSVKERLPDGNWSGIEHIHPEYSNEVLVCNTAGVSMAFYDRTDGIWYTGCPAEGEWIDKITHWAEIPEGVS